jgi:hypothetical protein
MDNPRGLPAAVVQPTVDEAMVLTAMDLDASLAALHTYWEEDNQMQEGFEQVPSANEVPPSDSAPYMQLLLGPWEKVPLELLDPDFTPPSTARQAILPDLPAHAPAAWDVNTVLQQYMAQS